MAAAIVISIISAETILSCVSIDLVLAGYCDSGNKYQGDCTNNCGSSKIQIPKSKFKLRQRPYLVA